MDTDIFGIVLAPTELQEDLQDRVDIVIHKLKFFPEKPLVACVSSINPFKLANQRILNSINLAGGKAVTEVDSLAVLINENPEIIIFSFEGQNELEAMTKMQDFLSYDGVQELNAVKNNKIYIANALDFFDKSDAENSISTLESIAEIITPRYFNFGFEGERWIKFELA